MAQTWEVNTGPNHSEEIMDSLMKSSNLKQQLYKMKWCVYACVHMHTHVLGRENNSKGLKNVEKKV